MVVAEPGQGPPHPHDEEDHQGDLEQQYEDLEHCAYEPGLALIEHEGKVPAAEEQDDRQVTHGDDMQVFAQEETCRTSCPNTRCENRRPAPARTRAGRRAACWSLQRR